MQRVTIKNLAELSGVSAKTVSKALNDQPGVNEELRERIKKLAKELDYVPNPFGRGLQGKSLKTIGVITSDNTNPNNAYHIKGIENRALESGYNIILCNANEDSRQEERHVRVLIERQIDGIILTPSPTAAGEEHNSIRMMRQFGIPFVLMNRTIPGEDHSFVKVDNTLGAQLAVEHLIENGHRNIIHLTLKEQTNSSQERASAFVETMERHGFSAKDDIYICNNLSMEEAYQSMLEILRQHKKFTAVFAFNDIIALGAMKAIHDCRLRIPSDIAVIGYDNIPFSSSFIVPLTTIQQCSYDIGYKAMELLLDKFVNPDANEQHVLFEPVLVKRESV